MTHETLKAWMAQHALTEVQASVKLGIVRNTLRAYLKGKNKIPLAIAYTCAAIDAGIEPLK